ncbi:MAG: Asp-tRNA(Asn)/Glu-tRNA(Gln) amidotransferase subunit GatC [Pseudomonadota bacterium]|nr:Asp-tRNA(Asn)/Glu-tRNA(Gln) amidotransferase subunit GatC [Gammaproteobacteria bacterium]MBU1558995.1 Asp-tRNA(Asn)/Glu-tRNA(Gln) amidotransferase subunit GatC [Gammaproteobacteria bacterium]MBU1927263.1 Asp-tRNA(Asn)/Glu-tRNA(Gln) amidotransferase subunit GatC [Gammaproteobacteria bacterium]MBU2545792.1 Asp-tRNA(Asn)/Glu-tRNA(Gln) amidotransferase subunit GatC [Gammaproteobacteria bacterium]
MERKDILKFAKMARIRLSEEEIDSFADFEKMHSFLRQLDNVGVTGIEPMAHPLEQSQRLRSDEYDPKINRSSIQTCASHTKDFIYLAPENIKKSTD